MTNKELIAKIKAEIERQQKENVNYDENGDFASYCDHSTWMALDSMLTFVSGLEESEKPVPAELEEAANEYSAGIIDREDAFMCKAAYIAGAKRQKEKNDKNISEKIAAAYQLGLADKKEMIMKSAVEKTVVQITRKRTPVVMLTLDANEYKDGDKVKVIICKKEDEK